MTPVPRFHFVSPGPLDQPTGGYGYDRRILEETARAGVRVVHHALPGRFPSPDRTACAAAERLWQSLGASDRVVIDGLALPAFEKPILHGNGGPRPLALVHHPLHLETGLPADEAERLRRIETALLQAADAIVATSPATGRTLGAMGIDAVPIHVVVPGTDPSPPAAGSGGETVALLCVAALTPRKGHLTLVSALSGLGYLSWRLDCVGPTDRDPATAAAVRSAIGDAGLSDRISLAGVLSETALAAAYHRADLFVLASSYEGYGMSFAEAMARGLPVVASGEGAVRETVPAEAGLVVTAGDRNALAASLAATIADRRLRARLGEGARAAGRALPDWAVQAERFLAAVSG